MSTPLLARVVGRMSRVTTMAATGALVLKDAVQKLNRRVIAVPASGVRPGRRRPLESVGALSLLRLESREHATTPQAIAISRRMIKVPGTEARWLSESAAQGHLLYIRREIPAVLRTVHIFEYGRLIARTPAQTVTGFRLAHAEAAR